MTQAQAVWGFEGGEENQGEEGSLSQSTSHKAPGNNLERRPIAGQQKDGRRDQARDDVAECGGAEAVPGEQLCLAHLSHGSRRYFGEEYPGESRRLKGSGGGKARHGRLDEGVSEKHTDRGDGQCYHKRRIQQRRECRQVVAVAGKDRNQHGLNGSYARDEDEGHRIGAEEGVCLCSNAKAGYD